MRILGQIVYLFASNLDISDVEQDIKTLYVLPEFYGYYAKQLKDSDSEARLREMPEDMMSIYSNSFAAALTEKPVEDPSENSESESTLKSEPMQAVEPEQEPMSAADGGLFSARLEALINSALQDGILTEKEKAILKKRAEAEGEDWDEVEMIVNARLAEKQSGKGITSTVATQPQPDASKQENEDLLEKENEHKRNALIIETKEVSDDGYYIKKGEKIIIPASTKIIKERQFDEDVDLVEVVLPSSLLKIEDFAFSGCSNLVKIDFSQCLNLQFIGDSAFYGCALKEIVIPDSVEVIGCNAIEYNEMLESATIGESAKNYFYKNNFSSCRTILSHNPNLKELTFKSKVAEYTGAKSLTNVIFSDTVKELGQWAVAECSNLEKVVIPGSVVKIGYGAFAGCKKLSSLELSDNISVIEDDAFALTNINVISFPKGLRKLGRLGDGFEKLRKIDFSKVTQLEVIPENFIGDNTPKLKELALPMGIQKIEERIGGENLNKLFLPPTIQEVEDLHQSNLEIYCFAPRIEELGLMIESLDDPEDACRLYVLPQYLDLYKAQREAEDISEDLLIIDVIPEEYRYYYDN